MSFQINLGSRGASGDVVHARRSHFMFSVITISTSPQRDVFKRLLWSSSTKTQRLLIHYQVRLVKAAYSHITARKMTEIIN